MAQWSLVEVVPTKMLEVELQVVNENGKFIAE